MFLVGPPGVGKTTLARALLDPDPYLVVKPKWTVGETMCAAGHYSGGTFDGADTVAYNGVKAALDYWATNLHDAVRWTLFDGDRFSYEGVLDYFRAHGVAKLLCVNLAAGESTLSKRRAERGSNQNAAWMKGRVTKAQRFAEKFERTSRLDLLAEGATERLATTVRQHFVL
jgi:hypothetical protein